jgi:hypothetical protein
MLIEVISGHETFDAHVAGSIHAGTVKVLPFYRKSGGAPEFAIATAVKDRFQEVQQSGQSQFFNASQENRNHGMWVTSRYVVPEFSFIKLLISRKEHGSFVPRVHQVVLRMRGEAALVRMRIPFTGNPQATQAAGYVEGRFDIITPEQFEALNFTTMPGTDRQYSFEEAMYEISILENESSRLTIPKFETVATFKGREIKVNRTPSTRKIVLKRRT